MIVRVIPKGGSDMPGLAAYMWGPGKAEEHTDQKMIASTGAGEIAIGDASMFFVGDQAARLNDETLDSVAARAEGAKLEADWRRFREESKQLVSAGTRQLAESESGSDGDVLRVDEAFTTSERQPRTGWNRPHVMHVTFALREDEGQLSDETWGRIAADYVKGMGFAGSEDEPGCRWAAWRHGLSASGNDHIHVAVCLVREDGRWANEHRSFMRSRTIGDELEKKYGLRPVKDSEQQRGMPAYTKGEARRMRESGTEIPERQRLAMVVRTAAMNAGTEKQFIAEVLRQGVRVRPRFSKDGTEVTGASYTFRDGSGPWLGGTSLARDLTLPKLRAMWDDTPQNRAEAKGVWDRREGIPKESAAPTGTGSWNAAQQALAKWAAKVEQIDPRDYATWSSTARDAAAITSELTRSSGGRQEQLLAHATQELARNAQTRQRVAAPAADDARVACRHISLALRSASKSDAAGWWAVWQQLSRVNRAIHGAQSARGELVRAQRFERAAHRDLVSIQNGLRKAAESKPAQTPRPRAAQRTTETDREQGR